MERNNNVYDLKDALEFLLSNKLNLPQKLDKLTLKSSIEAFSLSAECGLSAYYIKRLCSEIIFQDHYDIITRRKLLYSCIPLSSDFPYEIIPLAVSSATLMNVSSTWQSSILSWLMALLHFHVIDESNHYVHVCYPALFNMLSSLKTCHHVCKILCQITQREDVIPSRVQLLLRLDRKLGFNRYIPHLIRIYKVFRPDLIVYRPSYVKSFSLVTRLLQEPLVTARARLEMEDDTQDHCALWPNIGVKRKANPYHEPSALPQPEVLVYADKLEEQKKRMISILQFKSIKDMIKHLSLWKVWRWPNSASTLLWYPATISLFRPHVPRVKIAITNWLEIALRTEVIDQLGNPSLQRQESLLQACLELLKETETMVPIVYHFLIEFLVMWDKFSHFPKVLELLSYVPFISSSAFFVSFMESISVIMATADVSLVSAILDAFANTCHTWALQADRERAAAKKVTSAWPLASSDQVGPLEGIHFLTVRLERMMMATLLRLGPHPLLLISVINYYYKVNMGCDMLNLPLILIPPPEFFFVVLTSANIVATHQLGHLLSSMQMLTEKVKSMKVSGDEVLMRSITLLSVDSINFCVRVYLDTVVKRKSFNNYWMDSLAPFVGIRFLKKLTSVEGIVAYGNILQALNYLPLSLDYLVHKRDSSTDADQMLASTEKAINDLAELKMDGIHSCAASYIQRG